MNCKKYINEPMRSRWRIVKNLNLCYNCLNGGHVREHCNFQNQCNQCNRRHNQTLHFYPTCEEMHKSTSKHQNTPLLHFEPRQLMIKMF